MEQQPDKIQEQAIQQDYTTLVTLLSKADVEQAKKLFTSRDEKVTSALEEYDPEKHAIMERPEKLVNGELIDQARLPVSYQKKIVESSVAFLFGKPVKVINQSEGTDDAFAILEDVLKESRWHARNRETARRMFSETSCAKLFIPYRDKNAPAEATNIRNKVRIVVLSKASGDTLHTLFDNYGRMLAFARGYKTKNADKEVEHFDVYTADTIFYSNRTEGNWAVSAVTNIIGKIPVVYYEQEEAEWYDVKHLITRLEKLISRRADVNDYTADPVLVIEGKVTKLPNKSEAGKVIQLENGAKATYLTPQMVVEMVKDERDTLLELIHYLTDTPNLSTEKMKNGMPDSGKALEMLFFAATLKAMNKQEVFEEMIDREMSILRAIIGIAIDTSKKAQADALKLEYIFGNPLPDDYADTIKMISEAVNAKVLSRETGVGHIPFVKNAGEELARIKAEGEEAMKQEITMMTATEMNTDNDNRE